nr:RNA-dependent RNA polymerase [Flumine nodavirus 26]
MVDDSGREIGRSVAKSIVKYPDFIPNKSFNNDWLSIEYRVKKVVNDVVVPPRFLKFADEFIQRVLGDNKGVGVPIDHYQVRLMQKKPMQRARLEKSEYWILSDPSINIRSFMKSETYGKVNAPRNISTVGVTHTIQLSAYTYAFKKSVLYPKRWYAPGKSPQEIARRVADIANNYNKVSETDYEKFDGTVSFWLRENIEQAMYLKWCAPEHREHLNELLSQEINQYARTSHNLPYEPRASRLSGSPLTTDGNTLINAFVSYAALRSANVSADHAYDYLGIYGGDDGISTVSSSHLNRAAKDLGLRLKCIERRVSNNDVVTFLGRVYPNAWFGDTGSIQDPMRTWKKLHISFANPNITDNQALADRALGYYLLDTNAPVTSEWCIKALEISGKEGRITEYDTPFFVRSEVGECYSADGKLIEDLSGPTTKMIGRTKVPLEVNGWPQLGYDAAVEAISRMTGMTSAEIESVNDKIKMAQTLEELEGIITNEDTAPAVVAAVGHDIVIPPKSDAASNNTVVVARKPSRRNTRRNGKDHPNEGRERSKPRTGGGVAAKLPRSEASSSMPAKLPSARKGDVHNKPARVTQSDNGAVKRRTRTPKRST